MGMSTRLNVRHHGARDAPALMLVHGFGCDQAMWHHVLPLLTDHFQVITLDLVGAGGSDRAVWDAAAYASLQTHADDLVALLRELDLRDVVLVGHSVSAMIVALAQIAAPEHVSHLVMVGPSPRYLDDDGYVGGFTPEAIDGLLDALSANYFAWASTMAPVIAGTPERPEVAEELTTTFCRMDPEVAEVFARATFLSDMRYVLPKITAPTLVLQCAEDVIAPRVVGEYVAREIPRSEYVLLEVHGHCPQLSSPESTVDAIIDFLQPVNA